MDSEAIQKIADLANLQKIDIRIAAEGGEPFVVMPNGLGVQSVERYLPAPLQIAENIELNSLDSFAAYVNEYKSDKTKIFVQEADSGKVTFIAYFDYHQKDKPSWRHHRAALSFDYDDDFKAWKSNVKHRFMQQEFAEFIQEQIHAIIDPDGATLLEMCLTLEGKAELRFGASHRLDNGQVQFSYEENIEVKGGKKGTVFIPEALKLQFPFYRHGDGIEVMAQLRHRVNKDNGAISFSYVIPNMNKLLQNANDKLVESMVAKVDMPCLWGVVDGRY